MVPNLGPFCNPLTALPYLALHAFFLSSYMYLVKVSGQKATISLPNMKTVPNLGPFCAFTPLPCFILSPSCILSILIHVPRQSFWSKGNDIPPKHENGP